MPGINESIQDQTVAASNINSLEKYKFIVNDDGLVRVKTEDDFIGVKAITQNNLDAQALRVSFGRTENFDAFGRFRTSMPHDVFDNKNISSRSVENFDEVVSGTGSITYNRQTASVNLSITGVNGARALRQSRYLQYIPGKSQLIEVTSVLTNSAPAQVNLVIRSSCSGSVVENRIPQSAWNRDRVDGSNGVSNRSGVTINFTKCQIFHIDFQWLGVGNVRTAIMSPSGSLIELHEFQHPNSGTTPYMRTPSLPIRYEAVADATTIYYRKGYFDDSDGIFIEATKPLVAGTHTVKEICCTCSSEGAERSPGIVFNSNTRLLSITSSTLGVNVMAVRLKNSFGTFPNRKTCLFLNAELFATDQNVWFEIIKVLTYTDTASVWVDVDSRSACEVAKGSGIVMTVTDSILLNSGVISSAKVGGGPGSLSSTLEIIDDNRLIKQNYDSTKSQIYLIKAYTITQNSTVLASINWMEQE